MHAWQRRAWVAVGPNCMVSSRHASPAAWQSQPPARRRAMAASATPPPAQQGRYVTHIRALEQRRRRQHMHARAPAGPPPPPPPPKGCDPATPHPPQAFAPPPPPAAAGHHRRWPQQLGRGHVTWWPRRGRSLHTGAGRGGQRRASWIRAAADARAARAPSWPDHCVRLQAAAAGVKDGKKKKKNVSVAASPQRLKLGLSLKACMKIYIFKEI